MVIRQSCIIILLLARYLAEVNFKSSYVSVSVSELEKFSVSGGGSPYAYLVEKIEEVRRCLDRYVKGAYDAMKARVNYTGVEKKLHLGGVSGRSWGRVEGCCN